MTRQPGTNTVAGQTHPDTKRHTQHNYNLVRDTSRKTKLGRTNTDTLHSGQNTMPKNHIPQGVFRN